MYNLAYTYKFQLKTTHMYYILGKVEKLAVVQTLVRWLT